jgi:hypothetical protein
VTPAATPTPREAVPAVPAAREQGWWRLLAAAIAFVLLAEFPVLRALVPVHQPLLLLVPALAACAIVGWWRGGSPLLALLWGGFAALRLFLPLREDVNSAVLAAGWAALLAGCFGLALLVSRSKRFLPVAGAATASALLLATLVVVVRPAGPAALDRVVTRTLASRGAEDQAMWQAARSRVEGRPGATLDSASRAALDAGEATVAALPRTAKTLLPATLALQSLAALALAWGFWHRISRTRVGQGLGALRDFRFNDQLVWAVIAGLVLLLLPGAEAYRGIGGNLLLFFGTLYALRGAGVLAWFVTPRRTLVGVLVGVALLLLLRDGAAVALGIVGIGDTWADWRRRAARTA